MMNYEKVEQSLIGTIVTYHKRNQTVEQYYGIALLYLSYEDNNDIKGDNDTVDDEEFSGIFCSDYMTLIVADPENDKLYVIRDKSSRISIRPVGETKVEMDEIITKKNMKMLNSQYGYLMQGQPFQPSYYNPYNYSYMGNPIQPTPSIPKEEEEDETPKNVLRLTDYICGDRIEVVDKNTKKPVGYINESHLRKFLRKKAAQRIYTTDDEEDDE